MADITRDEVSLYDRQIRLWGLDGQRRLHEANVLVVGFDAVTVEVVKNVVLAGVGALTIADDNQVSETDLEYNFFVTAQDIGANRVEAGLVRVQRLNPRVAVTAHLHKPADLHAEFLGQFDVVVTSGVPFDEMTRINAAVRDAGHAFYATGLFGWMGYIFADLVEHTFTVERPRPNAPTKLGRVSLTREVLDAHVDSANNERLQIREVYAPLHIAVENAVKLPFASTLKPRARARVTPYLPALLASWETATLATADVAAKARALGLPATIVTHEFVASFGALEGVQISAVAAVVGGQLAQDMINYLTRREYPIQNIVIYDAKSGQGPMYVL